MDLNLPEPLPPPPTLTNLPFFLELISELTQEFFSEFISQLTQNTPLAHFGAQQENFPPPPEIRTLNGGLCVVDMCVDTTALSPEDIVSFY